MIIIKLKGGLGNQMFQYAVGRAIKERTDMDISYDLCAYKEGGTASRDTIRHFGLNNFNTNVREATAHELAPFIAPFQKFTRKVKAKIFSPNWYDLDENILKPDDNSYIEGWWQTDLYFKEYADIIRKEFTLNKTLHPELSVQAQSLFMSMKEFRLPGFASVSLHVRRGDYVSNSYASAHHGTLDISYYEKALKMIEEKTNKRLHVFVFSDDIEWVKAHIQTGHSMSYVSCPEIRDYEEIILMSHCDHHIIANSTFSWWGAWLNPSKEKIVIAPKDWIKNSSIKTEHALPSDWIRI